MTGENPKGSPAPGSRRDRYRAQTREEAKTVALSQLAASGPAGISVNAIAKAMGMTGPALYRYFASRDDLLTELIIDAYGDLADILHHAIADTAFSADPADRTARLRALAHALRDWARQQPDRYLLIFGTPIPGYTAPPAATATAARMMEAVQQACAALDPPTAVAKAAAAVQEDVRSAPAWTRQPKPNPPVLHRALCTWTRLHGLVSLEIQGHFTGMGFDPALLFEAEIESLAS